MTLDNSNQENPDSLDKSSKETPEPFENSNTQDKSLADGSSTLIQQGEEVAEFKTAQKKIKSGFMWLGISSIVSQGLDAISLIIVMMYLTKAEMGLATLAVSFSKCIEAFNGLGVGKALVQDSRVTVNETHSLFWFAVGIGVLVTIVMVPIGWGVSYFYHSEALFILILVSLVKVIPGGISYIPRRLIEKRLEYSKGTLIITSSTIFSAIAKIVLAILGAGAWALVGAHILYGLVYMVVALLCAHYRPQLHFKWDECKRFVKFGIQYCFSNLIETLNKNIHYFIVGKFFGESTLGVYRVGYELAMTPALALLDVVNDSSYAVFSKVKDKKDELSKLFAWNQGNIAIFSLVPIVFILFCSRDIFSLINDGQWMGAVSFIPLVLTVAFFKALIQTFPELYRACGKPGFALKTDSFECSQICLFFISALGICYVFEIAEQNALNVLFASWVLLFVPLLMFHLRLAKKLISTGFRSTVKSISKALAFGGIASLLSLPLWYFQDNLPFQPWLHMGAEVVVLLMCIGVYAKWIRKKPTAN